MIFSPFLNFPSEFRHGKKKKGIEQSESVEHHKVDTKARDRFDVKRNRRRDVSEQKATSGKSKYVQNG